MHLLVLGGLALIFGGGSYIAHEVRGGIQDATRSPVAGLWAVAALAGALYLIRKKVK